MYIIFNLYKIRYVFIFIYIYMVLDSAHICMTLCGLAMGGIFRTCQKFLASPGLTGLCRILQLSTGICSAVGGTYRTACLGMWCGSI